MRTTFPGVYAVPLLMSENPEQTASAEAAPEAPADQPERRESAGSGFDVRLPIYDGPIDLLLDLVRKHKLDILDLPIAQITEQYLDYLRRAEELNIDLGGEFVFMASTLIHIKSKMLLPKDPKIPGEEQDEEDPRAELVQQLLEREKFRGAAEMLKEKRVVEENVWSNPPVDAFEDDDEPGLAVGVFDLVKTFEAVLERFKNRPTYEIEEEQVSVASRIEFLRNMLLSEDRPVALTEVFERQTSVQGLIATFLAVLEMVRMQAVLLRQSEAFGSIMLRRHKMFDAVFADGSPWTAADAEYSA